MRIDVRPRKRNAPRIAEKAAPQFLQWLRGRPCVIEGKGGCGGRMEAAHVDYAGGKGMGTKVRDSAACPLCSEHHRAQHSWGWKTFEANFGFEPGDFAVLAEAYWRAWPGRRAWEAKLEAEQ